MKDDILSKLWSKQNRSLALMDPKDIIALAKKQRKAQRINIMVMTVTIVVLLAYTVYTAAYFWNNFTMGLVLMISSLLFRGILEMVTMYKRENQLISMSNKSYYVYLKAFYRMRLMINYIITPLCLTIYTYGFFLLLPYFKNEFSKEFYNYILISGILSSILILGLIIKSIIKERKFLNDLNSH